MFFADNPINSIGLPVTSANYINSNRFKRVSNQEFNDSLEKMQKVSRLTNAVFLVQGLVKGNISSDELISEFLNFGAYKPSDVDQVDTDKLKNVVQKLQELSKNLAIDAGVEKMLARLSSISSIVNMPNKVEKLIHPGDAYLQEVLKLKGQGVFPELVFYSGKVKTIIKVFKKIREKEPIGSVDILTLNDSIDDLKNAKFDTIKTGFLNKTKSLKNYQNKFKMFTDAFESMDSFNKKKTVFEFDSTAEKGTLKTLEGNMNKLDVVVKTMKDYSPKLDVLKQIVISRHHKRGNADLKYTSGFPNGFSDLGLVSNDLQDGWVQETLHGHANDIAVALKMLEAISNHFTAIDVTIVKHSKESFDAVSRIISEITELSKKTESFKSVFLKLSDVQTAASATDLIPTVYDKCQQLYKHISSLFDEINAIGAVVDLFDKLKSAKNTKMLKNIISKTEHNNENELNEKLKLLRNDSDFKEISKVLESAHLSVSFLTQERKTERLIETPVNSIETDFQYLKPFIDQSDKFLQMLKKLGSMKEFSSMGSIVSVLREFKKSTTEQLSDFSSVAGCIENVKSKLKEAEKEINEKKGSEGRELDALVAGKYVSDDSKDIGSTTRVLSAMKRMANEEFKIDWDYVKLIVQRLLKTIKAEDRKNLEIVIDMGDELKHLKSEIKKEINSATPITFSKFEDLAIIADKFKNIDGIDDDFGKLIESVRMLIMMGTLTPSDSGVLQSVIPVFEKLDQIGLNFAKHYSSFDKSKDALNSMDLFFANFEKTLAASTSDTGTLSKPGQVPGSHGSSGSGYGGRSSIHRVPKGLDWRFVIGIPLIGSIVTGLFALWKYRKEIFRKGPPKEPVKPPVLPSPRQKNHPARPPQPDVPVTPAPEPEVQAPPSPPPPPQPVPIPGEALPPPIPVNTQILVQQLEYIFEKHRGDSYNFVRFFDLTHEHLHKIPPKPALLHVHRDEWRQDMGYLYTTEFNFLTRGFEKAFIHANVMTVGKTKKLILTQAPMVYARARTIETIEKFFMMAIEERTTQIFQLCDWSETSTIMADVYIPEGNEPMSFGRIRVTRRREFTPEAAGGHVVVTIINVADPKTNRETTIEHHRYTNWRSGMCPEETAPMAYMIKRAFENPKSCAIVHCSGGFSRTGCFAFIMLGVEMLRKNRQFTVTQLFKEVRNVRPGCIETGDQIGFSMLVIFAICSENRIPGEQEERYTELMRDFRTKYLSWLQYGEAPRGYPVYVLPPE
ncbi:unnamed protein product [Caenorhabditis brenneri]